MNNKNFALSLLLLLPQTLMAAEDSEIIQPVSPLDNLDLMQMLAPLLMVIALIFALTWLVKKLNPGLPKLGNDIQVISTTHLSNQARLCLVRAGGKDILVGVTNSNVSHIQTFDEPVIPPTRESENPAQFSQQFKKLLNRKESDS